MGLITDIEEIASHNTERKNPSDDGGVNKFYSPRGNTSEQIPPQQVAENKEPEKISHDKAEQSGLTSAYLITSSVEMIRGGILLYKHVNSLTDKEKSILEIANTKNSSDLNAEEISVVLKYVKESKKYEEKKLKISTNEKDMKMLTEGFTTYAKVTGKEASPNLIIATVMVKYFSSIAMDSFLD